MTLGSWLSQAVQNLQDVGIISAQLDAELIAAFAFGKGRSWVLAHTDKNLNNYQEQDLQQFLNRRLSHEPLAYIFGKTEFYGLELYVDKRVLIPRPESEAIVEYVIKNTPINATLLDLGTGSGALAVASKKNRPDLDVYASDISTDALDVAKRNASSHGVDIAFIESDLLQSVTITPDWIIANLPYVPKESDLNEPAKHEPALALLANNNGVEFYDRLFGQLDGKEFSSTKTVIAESNPGQFTQLSIPWQQRAISDFVTLFER